MTVSAGYPFSGPTYRDGNALAGPLSEIFAVDVTAAVSRCAHCTRTGPLGGLHVYDRGPGRVARCPGCGEVMMRMVRGRGEVWLDMSGTAALAIPMDDR
ncbi:DUF6510 family protein [Streptomyces sp. AM8-1-1]|uniref:DUF6510 family protein n=1 Tax=Streptomyces sp. AM8-1-1 TaxID=3075825 RepID=UPI0028C47433|nr:DUF6510 family protein [Streptomyces sp. AM8-1-1]WNO71717.1 DUF6510 family protein [Streptomyces sp. AM8-1-1]